MEIFRQMPRPPCRDCTVTGATGAFGARRASERGSDWKSSTQTNIKRTAEELRFSCLRMFYLHFFQEQHGMIDGREMVLNNGYSHVAQGAELLDLQI